MSAFLVQDSTIDRIVDFCYMLTFQREAPLAYLKSPVVLNNYEDCIEFGKKLYAMNVVALVARYDTRAVDLMPDNGHHYRSGKVPTMGAMLKHLDCYLYQCSEGSVPEEALYVSLDVLRDSLARVIASEAPDYKAAAWE